MVPWIILAVAIGATGLGVVAFNKLRRADVRADEALGGIDVQLTRRADLMPNLVTAVRGYAEHERAVFDEVTNARTGVAAATGPGSVERKAQAELRLDRALVDVMAVAEAYPDLKASQNFQQLQEELSQTEDNLTFSRQYYNDAVRELNESMRTLPWLLFNRVAGVTLREFYQTPTDQSTPPTIDF